MRSTLQGFKVARRGICIAAGVLCFLAVLVAVFFMFCDNQDYFVSRDFRSYLKNGTEFENTATNILPSNAELEETDILFYEFYHKDNRVLRLDVAYSQSDFNSAKEEISAHLAAQNSYCREDFYFDGQLYHGYVFYNNTTDVHAYAMAYSFDLDSHRISYMLYESFDLQIMTIADALATKP